MDNSDHFDGLKFFNPRVAAPQPMSAVPRMMAEPRTPWPQHVEVEPQPPAPLDGARAVVTFIGHATFLIQTPAGNFLTDPMYSRVAGPLNLAGPRRVREPGVRFDDLPPIATVLLSHNHYDHCDLRTLRHLRRTFKPLVLTPIGNRRAVRKSGIKRIEELDWWQSVEIGGARITLTPARHFSARTLWDRNRALWGGFVIELPGLRIYFAGDTAYTPFFEEIRARLGAIDVALLPIGAYEPRWFMQAVHMNPADAVQAHLDLGSPQSIAMHFGTFPMTIEPIDAPLHALGEELRTRGIPSSQFRALDFGESLRIE